MRRKECINGEWSFRALYDEYEPQETIHVENWETIKIRVPSSWRYRLGKDKEYDWDIYNVFDYPDEWNKAERGIISTTIHIKRNDDERVVLVFNGIYQRSKIYLDDRLICSSEEAFLPIRVDITRLLKSNDQWVDIKVWCGEFKSEDTENGRKSMVPDGSWFGKLSRGIWQDVFVEYLPKTHIEDYHIVTSFRNKEIKIDVGLFNDSFDKDYSVKAFILEQGNIIKKIETQKIDLKANELHSVTLGEQWDNAICWSHENPYLYDLKLEIFKNEEVVDSISTRFGFREFWTEGHKYYLNGIRINLRGDSWHYQGFVQQTKEYALNWYKVCKEAGMNFVRLHGNPYPSFYLDAADEIGMLVIDESAIYGSSKSMQADHPEYLRNCYKHLELFIRRDRNHPSVFMWSMQNEMRWVDGRDGYKQHIPDMMALINRLDGTRLISCDGDNRLMQRENMQVVNMHYNIDGKVSDWDKTLPLFFGEHGKFHYVSPQVASTFVGHEGYLDYEAAIKDIGITERLFLEYARKQEVTGISPYNMANYMMKSMPEEDIELNWDNLSTPGVKPKRIKNYSTTINNGLMQGQPVCTFNNAFQECADAYKNIAIIADDYDTSFYDECHVERSFSLYNETLTSQQAEVQYKLLTLQGKTIQASKVQFEHAAGGRYDLHINLNIPKVEQVTCVQLVVSLYYHNELKNELTKQYKIYSSSMKYTALPETESKLTYIGDEEGHEILKKIVPGIQWGNVTKVDFLQNCHTLVIGKNIQEDIKDIMPAINEFVKSGGVLLVLEQSHFAPGELILSGKKFFNVCITDRQHEIFNGLDNADLAFWDKNNVNDPNCEYMITNAFNRPVKGDVCILAECAEGDFGWGGLLWSPLLEYKVEKGMVILNQFELLHYYETVPQSCLLLKNMLAYVQHNSARHQTTKAALVSQDYSEFTNFMNKVGIKNTLVKSEAYDEYSIVIVEPDTLKDFAHLQQYAELGGQVIIPRVEPRHEQWLRQLIGRDVIVEKTDTYQLEAKNCEELKYISAHDLYYYEKVTYSSASKQNVTICDYAVEVVEAIPILSTVNNPWREFFIDKKDAGFIKIAVATREENRIFNEKHYGWVIPCGKGKIILTQVKFSSNEKAQRFYIRLLCNLGVPVKTDVLEYVKADTDYSIPSLMVLQYDGKKDFSKMEAYFSDGKYVLNNLGEGVYGWMTRVDQKDGSIVIPCSSGKTFFATVFIYSELNRNPEKREEGQFPDSSIVPDLYIHTNASFKLWVNGICHWEHKAVANGKQLVKIPDIVLDKGMNRMLLICTGAESDIKLSAYFLNKYGDSVEKLKYIMTLD